MIWWPVVWIGLAGAIENAIAMATISKQCLALAQYGLNGEYEVRFKALLRRAFVRMLGGVVMIAAAVLPTWRENVMTVLAILLVWTSTADYLSYRTARRLAQQRIERSKR